MRMCCSIRNVVVVAEGDVMDSGSLLISDAF